MTIRHAAVVAAITLTLTSTACGSTSDADAAQPVAPGAPVTLRVATTPSQTQGLKAAIEQGFLAARNITVELQTISGGPNIVSAVIGGSVDIGYADVLAGTSGISNKFDITLVAPNNFTGAGSYVLAKPGSGITKPADLVGRSIGVGQTAQHHVLTKLWLEKNGVDPASVKLVSIAQNNAHGEALAAGRVDAIRASGISLPQWQHQYGFVRVGVNSPESFVDPKATVAAFWSRTDWATSHQDVVARFTDALREGNRWYLDATPEERAPLHQKYDKVDLVALDRTVPGILRSTSDTLLVTGPIDPAATQSYIDTAARLHDVPRVDLTGHLFPTATAATTAAAAAKP